MMKPAAILLFFCASCAGQGLGGKSGIGGSAGIGGGPSTAIAIAFDAAATGALTTSTTMTQAIAVGSGTNRMLLACVSSTSTTTVPTVTYNGSAMTALAGSTAWFFGGGKMWMFAQIAPTSGTNNIVVTFGSSTSIGLTATSYTGVNQSVTPDAVATGTSGSASTATVTLTTVANNAWMFSCARGSTGATVTAGSGAFLRTSTGQTVGSLDSNAPITPAGSTSQTSNFGSSVQEVMIAVSFAHA